jgi:hypothetical protein
MIVAVFKLNRAFFQGRTHSCITVQEGTGTGAVQVNCTLLVVHDSIPNRLAHDVLKDGT